MQRLQLGMAVAGIQGRRVGVVSELRQVCFEVKRPTADGGPVCLKPEAIFNVDKDGVTLVCAKEDIARYACGLEHAGVHKAAEQPTPDL